MASPTTIPHKKEPEYYIQYIKGEINHWEYENKKFEEEYKNWRDEQYNKYMEEYYHKQQEPYRIWKEEYKAQQKHEKEEYYRKQEETDSMYEQDMLECNTEEEIEFLYSLTIKNPNIYSADLYFNNNLSPNYPTPAGFIWIPKITNTPSIYKNKNNKSHTLSFI